MDFNTWLDRLTDHVRGKQAPEKPEEGGACIECGTGKYEIKNVTGCSCHINPPCHGCVEAPLVCTSCGHRVYFEDIR